MTKSSKRDIFKMPSVIDKNYKYIICPDITCTGFMDPIMQCNVRNTTIKLFPEKNLQLCPHIETAKLVVFCYWGHPIESVVNNSSWQRADCTVKDCHSSTFSRMSNITLRIPLDKYEEFLKLPRR